MAEPSKRFKSWRDYILTPLLELLILGGSIILTLWIRAVRPMGVFGALLVFLATMVLITLCVLRLVRLVFSLKRGIFSLATSPWTFYGWRLHSFLCTTNLFAPYLNGFLPPFLRKYFYRFLGAKMGRGFITIEGRFLDPYLVTVEEAVMIGDDALLIPFQYAVGSSDLLVLDPIEVKKGAVVGARSTLMPGVTVGENAMVRAMSLVPMNTKIPPNEIWEGIPARKVADVDRPIAGQGENY